MEGRSFLYQEKHKGEGQGNKFGNYKQFCVLELGIVEDIIRGLERNKSMKYLICYAKNLGFYP